MPFLTSQDLRARLEGPRPPILMANPARVESASYEMALGGQAFITSTQDATKQSFDAGEQISIPPGQFAMLLTEEEIDLSADVLAFISIKASKKMRGLVNVSGFHVDPGFHGRLKFSVYNAGSETIVLEVGEPLFPIWLYDLGKQDDRPYRGQHQGQAGISSEDVMRLQGEVASPAALKKDIDDLRATVGNWKAATIGAIAAAVIVLLQQLLKGGK